MNITNELINEINIATNKNKGNPKGLPLFYCIQEFVWDLNGWVSAT